MIDWAHFTPWTSLVDYAELVGWIRSRDLEGRVDPIQLAIRLLVPPGSLLLAHPEGHVFGPLDPARLSHGWVHPDPRMDALEARVFSRVEQAPPTEAAPETFAALRALVEEVAGAPSATSAPSSLAKRPPAPRLSEPTPSDPSLVGASGGGDGRHTKSGLFHRD